MQIKCADCEKMVTVGPLYEGGKVRCTTCFYKRGIIIELDNGDVVTFRDLA